MQYRFINEHRLIHSFEKANLNSGFANMDPALEDQLNRVNWVQRGASVPQDQKLVRPIQKSTAPELAEVRQTPKEVTPSMIRKILEYLGMVTPDHISAINRKVPNHPHLKIHRPEPNNPNREHIELLIRSTNDTISILAGLLNSDCDPELIQKQIMAANQGIVSLVKLGAINLQEAHAQIARYFSEKSYPGIVSAIVPQYMPNEQGQYAQGQVQQQPQNGLGTSFAGPNGTSAAFTTAQDTLANNNINLENRVAQSGFGGITQNNHPATAAESYSQNTSELPADQNKYYLES